MRNFKIMRIATLGYNKPFDLLYKNTDLHLKTYDQQQKSLFNQFFVYGNSFSRGMRLLGHEAIEIVADVEIMQKTWAKEKGLKYEQSQWKQQIILKQIEYYKPEIIYFQDIHNLSYDNFQSLKQKFPFIKLVIIFRGYPGITSMLLKALPIADIIFVGSPCLYNKLKEKKFNPFLIYHFFDDHIHNFIDFTKIELKHDFIFSGTSGYGYGIEHLPRYASLLELLRRSEIKVWIDELEMPQNNLLLKKIIQHFSFLKKIKIFKKPSIIDFWDHLKIINNYYAKSKSKFISKQDLLFMKPLANRFSTRCLSSKFGIEMYKLFAESKISFNNHTLAANGYADNMRMFQTTGMGSCLLTDDCHNMKDIFEKDKEIVTYSSLDECVEKVKYLLDHEEERQEIARKGQAKTLKCHSYKVRCKQMNEIFQKSM